MDAIALFDDVCVGVSECRTHLTGGRILSAIRTLTDIHAKANRGKRILREVRD